MAMYTLVISGISPDGESFEDVVKDGPAPDLATAIMWEKSALSDCKYVEVHEARETGQKGTDHGKNSRTPSTPTEAGTHLHLPGYRVLESHICQWHRGDSSSHL